METNYEKNSRRTDLDWIRVIAVFLLVPFHSALVFILNPNVVMYVKDEANSLFLDRFAGWIHQFHMPILFYVAGAATYFALKKRGTFQYLKERFLKLLLPACSGLVLLIPPMTYLSLIFRGEKVNFWQHFIGFWHINPTDLNGFSGSFTPAHLWFLIYLFIFSLITIPLFSLLRKEKIEVFFQKQIGKIGSLATMVVLFVLSAFAAKTNILGGINPIYYFVLYITGYLFMMNCNFQLLIDKRASLLLILGLLCEIIRQFFMANIWAWTESGTVILLIEQLNRWLWMLCFLGYGHRFLNKRDNLLKYLSSASFPFYIFHLIVNTIVGFFVIKMQVCIGIKYFLIVVITIALTLAVYEVARRIPFIRFLFGMRKSN